MHRNIDPAEVARDVFRHTLLLVKDFDSIPEAKPHLQAFGQDIAVYTSRWMIYFLAYVLNGKKSLDSRQIAYINRIIGQQYSADKLNTILLKGSNDEIYSNIGVPPFFLTLGKKIDDDVYHELFDNIEQLAYTAIILDDREEQDELARMEEVLEPIREALLALDNGDLEDTATSPLDAENDKPLIDNQEAESKTKNKHRSFDEVMVDLNAMVGLAAVKKEVISIANLVKYQQQRKLHKLPNAPLSLHLVFTGNPGTGKTTVARLIAEIFQSLGVLSSGHLVETDRSGMIAEYLGQTPVKVSNAVNAAMDGVLFIDEAYSLVSESDEDMYGEEAVSTLLKLMEDNRERLAVIVAGYTKEMGRFIETNPGLKSRFNRFIHFDDYGAEDLAEIYLRLCKQNRYKVPPSSKQALAQTVVSIYGKRESTFGNAREMRNLFERVVQNMANRVSQIVAPTKTDLVTILPADFS